MSTVTREEDLIAYARRAAKCIYIAVEKTVADDVSATITALITRVADLEQHLHAIADVVERHWKGAGLPLESGWIITEIVALADKTDAAEAHVGELERERDTSRANLHDWTNRFATSEARCDALRTALEEAQQALNTWVATYAGELCSAEAVEEARRRIVGGGGTLAYIADVSAHIRAALQSSPAGEE